MCFVKQISLTLSLAIFETPCIADVSRDVAVLNLKVPSVSPIWTSFVLKGALDCFCLQPLYPPWSCPRISRGDKGGYVLLVKTLWFSVDKLGYNDHGCNEFMAITNTMFGIIRSQMVTLLTFTIVTMSRL